MADKVSMALAELVRKAEADGDVDFLKEGVRVLSQALMEVEVAQHLGAERYERSGERSGQRNCYRERTWDTRVGTLDLKVPRVRDGSYFPSLLEPRKRAERALVAVVREAYVHGVSTRRVDDLVKALGLDGISRSQVTAITGCADATAPFDCTLPGDAVIHIEPNGEFSYTPGPGDTVGSFTYTVTDTPAVGIAASSTGTVTFTILDMIWYADAAAGGNGTSRLPFNALTATTLNGANGAGDLDDADDYIFVHAAAVSLNGGIELEVGQHLIGEAAGLTINRDLNGNGAPTVLVAPGASPVITSATGNSPSPAQGSCSARYLRIRPVNVEKRPEA